MSSGECRLKGVVARAIRLYEQEPGEAKPPPGVHCTCAAESGGRGRGWAWQTSRRGTAAAQGIGHAQTSLGLMYATGQGVPRDDAEVVKWYRKAAKRIFGIPDFRLFALADGIREVCARSPRRSQPGATDPARDTLGFG